MEKSEYTKPCWSFLWKRQSEPDGAWKCRKYRCKDIETACKRMASFLADRYVDWDDEIRVDTEACAEHVTHAPANHTATFPDLRSFVNPLQDYV